MEPLRTDVIEGIKPILLITKLFGLNVVSYRPSTNKLLTTRFDCLWSVIVYAMVTYASVGVFVDCSATYATTILTITTRAQRLATTLSNWINIPIGFIYRRNIINLLNAIKEFDGIFGAVTRISTIIACRKRSNKIIFILGSMNIITLASDIYNFIDEPSGSYCNIAHVVSYSLVFITEMFVIILFAELANRFKVMNIYLKKQLLTINPGGKLAITHERRLVVNTDVEDSLLFCSDIHRRLCDCAKGLNRTFQLQVTIKLFGSFVLSITASHFMATVTVQYTDEYIGDLIQIYLFNLVTIAFNLIEVVGIIYAFTFVQEEAKKTVRVLYQTSFKYSTTDLNNAILIFSSQIYFTKPAFTAFGLFPLDWTVIYTFFTAGFTFFIILMQLTSAEMEMNKSVGTTLPITTYRS